MLGILLIVDRWLLTNDQVMTNIEYKELNKLIPKECNLVSGPYVSLTFENFVVTCLFHEISLKPSLFPTK